jgi:hypothetical protein
MTNNKNEPSKGHPRYSHNLIEVLRFQSSRLGVGCTILLQFHSKQPVVAGGKTYCWRQKSRGSRIDANFLAQNLVQKLLQSVFRQSALGLRRSWWHSHASSGSLLLQPS